MPGGSRRAKPAGKRRRATGGLPWIGRGGEAGSDGLPRENAECVREGSGGSTGGTRAVGERSKVAAILERRGEQVGE